MYLKKTKIGLIKNTNNTYDNGYLIKYFFSRQLNIRFKLFKIYLAAIIEKKLNNYLFN